MSNNMSNTVSDNVGLSRKFDAGTASSVLGTAAGIGSYVIWGFLPVLFSNLNAAGYEKVIVQRILWTTVLSIMFLVCTGRIPNLVRLVTDKKQLAATIICALLLGANWLTHIYAILSNQVTDAGIGYLVNPLLTVVLGVVVLKESLTRTQWVGCMVAFASVLLSGYANGHIPIAAALLPITWSLYGLVHKLVPSIVDSLTSFSAEMLVLGVATSVYVLAGGRAMPVISGIPAGQWALFVLSGLLTFAPLVLYNFALCRTMLTNLGITQYLSAIIQICLGVLYFKEPLSAGSAANLILLVCALVIFAAGGAKHAGGDGKPSRRDSI
ncbi:EamA family transporter [Bifidobacterium olomucense]|uniref:Transporter DMT superfamily protein n=1 Tax=Bifidobacterium olomucense TaxID=2675324 RepID=A0A7Y0EXU3_9BIFI|nr:EamA family transporter [Bifidobacterium sp. DSM 109959]NMM98397.1 transporter DMT superfamily protein [Bifidobacterium sp. DSM 109959]